MAGSRARARKKKFPKKAVIIIMGVPVVLVAASADGKIPYHQALTPG